MLIPNLPLFWRFCDTPHTTAEIPARLDATIAMDPYGNVGLRATAEHHAIMEGIYAQGRSNFDRRASRRGEADYYRPFLDFIDLAVATAPAPFSVTSALDMGCGNGALAAMLNDKCGNAIGYEPWLPADPYPGAKICNDLADSRFDLIVHHHVLEHVADAGAFLQRCAEHLAPGGLMCLAVPDCTASIALGDISMALHQHLRYFNFANLHWLLKAHGFAPVMMAPHEGALMVAARRDTPTILIGAPPCDAPAFERAMGGAIARVGTAIAAARSAGRSIGFWCPLRALPYVAVLPPHGSTQAFRYFDDGCAGLWIDGMRRPIEGRLDFFTDPPDDLFVMSLTHGAKIEAELEEALATAGKPTIVRTLHDIIAL